MADEEAATPEGEAQEKKGGKKKLIIIIVVVLVLLGGGAGAFLAMSGGGEEGDAEAHVEPEEVLELLEMEPIIVNLSESTSFLKVTLVLEYDANLLHGGGDGHGGGHAYGGGAAGGGGDAGPSGPPGVFGEREPMIKDAIIRVLSSKNVEQVLTVEGKEMLKEELIEAINEATELDDDIVVNIYFKDFIIQ